MAKVKAPLFSLAASGSIGDALVYFGWKGLQVVREHVVPANPKTALQTTQRGYMTAAVAAIHAALSLAADPLDEADKTAYSALGNTRPTPRTWFNTICKLWIDCKVAGTVPIIYTNGRATVTLATGAKMRIETNEETVPTLAAGKFYLGTTRTALILSQTGEVVAGNAVEINVGTGFTTLTAGIKYYWQFRPDALDGCEGADSGIYDFYAT